MTLSYPNLSLSDIAQDNRNHQSPGSAEYAGTAAFGTPETGTDPRRHGPTTYPRKILLTMMYANAAFSPPPSCLRSLVIDLWVINSILSGLMFSCLDTSIVSTALVTISIDVGDSQDAAWTILGYLLTYMSKSMGTILTRPGPRLADT